MNKYLKQIFLLFCLVVILILPYFVFAASGQAAVAVTPPAPNTTSILGKLNAVAGKSYDTTGGDTKLASILGLVVQGFLGLLGVIFVILIVIAGNKWMTAAGEEEKVREAKDTIRRAIIGLIIIVGAWAIWIYVGLKLIGQ